METRLVADKTTNELFYKCSEYVPFSNPVKIVCALAWPLLAAIGLGCIGYYSATFFKAKWKQFKGVSTLSSSEKLNNYAEQKLNSYEKRINKLKRSGIHFIESYHRYLNPALPQNGVSAWVVGRWAGNYWKDYSWDAFLEADLGDPGSYGAGMSSEDLARESSLKELKKIQAKMIFLNQQKKILCDAKGDARLKIITKIAEFSFVKNSFREHSCLEQIIFCCYLSLPFGLSFYDKYRSPTNHRLIFENKKGFLPNTKNFKGYTDLVDACNTLIRENNFLSKISTKWTSPIGF